MMRIIGGTKVTSAMMIGNVNKNQRSPRRTTKCEEKGRCKLDFSSQKKPLQGKKVFLDIQNKLKVAEMTKQIEILGGKVEDFLSKEISLVVTSQKCVDKIETLKSAQSPSPHSTASPLAQQYSNRYSATQVHSPFSMDSPHHSVENVKKSLPSSVSRGKEVLLRAMSSKRGSGTPDVAGKAKKLGARLISAEEFMDKYMRRGSVKEVDITSLKNKRRQPMVRSVRHHSVSLQAMKLIEPYFKVEIKSRHYRPIFHEINKLPKIYSNGVRHDCPFDIPNEKKSRRKTQDAEMEQEYLSVAERSDENASGKEKPKDEKTKEVKPGVKISYCDCCCVRYHDLKKHIRSEKHRTFARNSDNYKDLDKLIAQCTPLEELLRLLKRDIGKRDSSDVESTNMESSINLKDNILECTLNRLHSSLQLEDKDIKICDKVVITPIDFIGKHKGKSKASDIIGEDKTSNQENDLEDIVFNEKGHLEKLNPEIDDNHGNEGESDSEKDDDADVHILDGSDTNLKELDKMDNKVECSNIKKQERNSNECGGDINPPSKTEKSTISCQAINMRTRNEKPVKHVAQDHSFADTSTEPYAICQITISDNEQSVLQENIVTNDSMYQLKHNEERFEKNHHKSNINLRKVPEDKVAANTCTLEVKTIFEVSSIETSSFVETLQTVSNNKDIPSKKKGVINVCTDTDALNKNTESHIDECGSVMDADNTYRYDIDTKQSSDPNISRNIPQDLNEPECREVILLCTKQIATGDHVDNLLPHKSESNESCVVKSNMKKHLSDRGTKENTELPVSTDTGTMKLPLCSTRSSTPHKHVSEKENELEFSFPSSHTSVGVQSFNVDEGPVCLLPTLGKDLISGSQIKMGCKENLSPICRRTKRKNRKKVLSCTKELDNVESDLNNSADEEYLKILEDELKEKENVKKELFSTNCVGASTRQRLESNLNNLNIITDLIQMIDNSPKRERKTEHINNDMLLKHMLEFRSPGGILKTEEHSEKRKGSTSISKVAESVVDLISMSNSNGCIKKKKKLDFGEDKGKSSKGRMKKSENKDNIKLQEKLDEKTKIMTLSDSNNSDDLGDSDDSEDIALSRIKGSSKAGILNIDDVFTPESERQKQCANTSNDLGDSDDSEDIVLSRIKGSSKDIFTPESERHKQCAKTRSKSNGSDDTCNSKSDEDLPLAKVMELSREAEDFLDDVFTAESNSKIEKCKSEQHETDNESEGEADEQCDIEDKPLDVSYRSFIKLYGRRSCKRNDQKRKDVSPVEPKRERKRSRSNNDAVDSVKGVSNRTLRKVCGRSSRSKKTTSTTSVENELKIKTLNEISSSISSSTKPITASPRFSERLVSSNFSTSDCSQKKRAYSERNIKEIDENIELCIRTVSQGSCISKNCDLLNSSPDAIKKKPYLDLNRKAPRGLESPITNFEFDEGDESVCSSQPSSSNLFKSPTRSKRIFRIAESSNRHESYPPKGTTYSSKKTCKSRSKSCGKAGQNVFKFSSGKTKTVKENSPYTTNAVFCKRNSSGLSSFDFTGT